MEAILKRVFDYQRFSGNERLNAMIQDVENRYRVLDAEDLAQMVFMKVFGKWDTFDQTKSSLST